MYVDRFQGNMDLPIFQWFAGVFVFDLDLLYFFVYGFLGHDFLEGPHYFLIWLACVSLLCFQFLFLWFYLSFVDFSKFSNSIFYFFQSEFK